MGGNLCNASPAADSVPALIAAGAIAPDHRPQGHARGPGRGRPARARARLAEEGRDHRVVPAAAPGPPRSGDAYLRFIPRTEMDIAVVGAGVNLTLDGSGTCTAARVALGAVAPTVLLVTEAGAGFDRHQARRGGAGAAGRGRARRLPADRRQARHHRIRIKVAGVLAKPAAQHRAGAGEDANDGQGTSRNHDRQRRRDRVLCRAGRDAARRPARRPDAHRHQGRLRHRRLRRLQRHARRPAGLLLPRARRSRPTGAEVETIEGMAKGDELHPLQQKFLEHARCNAASARRAS